MKKIAEKVALIALVCITFVFALTSVLYATDVIPHKTASDNSVAIILLCVLAAIFLGLAAYLIYVNFSESLNVKRIMLFYDAESATRANGKVIDNIVSGCAKQVDKIKVKKTKLRVDDKLGLIATVHVVIAAEDVKKAIPELHNLLAASFKDTLGLKFNAINFEIDKLIKKYVPATPKAEATVDTDAATTADDNKASDDVTTDIMETYDTNDETVEHKDLADA